MKIFIKAKPDSYQEKIEKIDDTHFVVYVKEPPVKGLANQAILKALGDLFNKSPNNLKIVSGYTSREKVIEIY